jgi:hypothetical protein
MHIGLYDQEYMINLNQMSVTPLRMTSIKRGPIHMMNNTYSSLMLRLSNFIVIHLVLGIPGVGITI